jgi:aminoglycoside phosphotransferase (APT) family kinase protein
MPTPPSSTEEPTGSHAIDVEALGAWIRANVEDVGPLTVRKFRGGESNPTYWVADDTRSYVLRKKPPGELLPSAHQVEREHHVLAALRDTDVPVARVYGLCEDEAVIGTPFYLMEHVEGRIFWNVRLPDLEPPERAAVYDELARVLAAIHAVDLDAVGLSDFGRQGGYVARQIKRWTSQYRKTETDTIEAMDKLIAWLPDNQPAGDETTLAHGDYRLDNLIFHPTEPRCLAVLDWELSTLGHPLADLAYTCMLYDIQMPRVGGLLGVDFEASGIPSESVFVNRYCELAGREGVERFDYYKAFGLFRLAAIVQGVYARGLQGNASSSDTAMYGAAVGAFSGVACDLVGI